jgi:hypothetical protein
MTDQSSIQQSEPEQKPNQSTVQKSETEQKPDTYHDPDKLTQFANIADILSWVFLFIFAVSAGIIVYLIYYFYKNHAPLEQFFLNLPSFLVPLIVGGFAWVVLKLISEGVYLLMDIEDNTRRRPPA